MIHFPDTKLKRYVLVETPSGVYGETVGRYVEYDEFKCDFQDESYAEVAEQYGVELADMYRIYTNLSVELRNTDVLVDEDGNTYDIIGSIKEYKKFHNYKSAYLKKRRESSML